MKKIIIFILSIVGIFLQTQGYSATGEGEVQGSLSLQEKKVRLTSLDRVSDEFLLEKLGSLDRMSVGPERIIKYMTTRENEVLLIRVLLMGKLHGLSPEILERRVEGARTGGGRGR